MELRSLEKESPGCLVSYKNEKNGNWDDFESSLAALDISWRLVYACTTFSIVLKFSCMLEYSDQALNCLL